MKLYIIKDNKQKISQLELHVSNHQVTKMRSARVTQLEMNDVHDYIMF